MLLIVHLYTSNRQALMVPEIALMQRASQFFGYTITDGGAEMIQVRTGVRREGWIEVLSGKTEAQTVITEGIIKIRNGSPVTTQLPGAPGPQRKT